MEGSGIVVPARNAEFLRWRLQSGMRFVQPISLMTIGLYDQPIGAFLTSISLRGASGKPSGHLGDSQIQKVT
jgi:hypothetical protein